MTIASADVAGAGRGLAGVQGRSCDDPRGWDLAIAAAEVQPDGP
jgi:hypothetical protein